MEQQRKNNFITGDFISTTIEIHSAIPDEHQEVEVAGANLVVSQLERAKAEMFNATGWACHSGVAVASDIGSLLLPQSA